MNDFFEEKLVSWTNFSCACQKELTDINPTNKESIWSRRGTKKTWIISAIGYLPIRWKRENYYYFDFHQIRKHLFVFKLQKIHDSPDQCKWKCFSKLLLAKLWRYFKSIRFWSRMAVEDIWVKGKVNHFIIERFIILKLLIGE